MKKLLVVGCLLVVGLLSYNGITRGKLTLFPASALSSDEKALQDLAGRLASAEKAYSQAGRAAGLTGMDMTADAEGARIEVERVVKELEGLKRVAASEDARQRADALLSRALDLQRRMGSAAR